MIQTIHLTFTGDFSDCEVHGVQTDGNLGQIRAVLRGYTSRERHCTFACNQARWNGLLSFGDSRR